MGRSSKLASSKKVSHLWERKRRMIVFIVSEAASQNNRDQERWNEKFSFLIFLCSEKVAIMIEHLETRREP